MRDGTWYAWKAVLCVRSCGQGWFLRCRGEIWVKVGPPHCLPSLRPRINGMEIHCSSWICPRPWHIDLSCSQSQRISVHLVWEQRHHELLEEAWKRRKMDKDLPWSHSINPGRCCWVHPDCWICSFYSVNPPAVIKLVQLSHETAWHASNLSRGAYQNFSLPTQRNETTPGMMTSEP